MSAVWTEEETRALVGSGRHSKPAGWGDQEQGYFPEDCLSISGFRLYHIISMVIHERGSNARHLLSQVLLV